MRMVRVYCWRHLAIFRTCVLSRRCSRGSQRAQRGSRGGFSTKIHLKTDFGGLPIAFHLLAKSPASVTQTCTEQQKNDRVISMKMKIMSRHSVLPFSLLRRTHKMLLLGGRFLRSAAPAIRLVRMQRMLLVRSSTALSAESPASSKAIMIVMQTRIRALSGMKHEYQFFGRSPQPNRLSYHTV